VKVLVTGAAGLLGGRLAALLAARDFAVVAARHQAPPPPGLPALDLDLEDHAALEAGLDDARPDAVVHAAVLSRADECERRPDRATELNARIPGRLAGACRSRGIRLVGLSTDLVFGGERALSDERTAPAPLSVYGRTKREGEEALLSADPAAAVARVALVAGRGHGPRGTASESIAWALRTGRTVRLFADEYRTPVDPESVADGVALLLERGGAGLFHLGGPERLSRLELGLRVARILGLPSRGIQSALQADYPGPDRRPADTSLDSARARQELGWKPGTLDRALRASRAQPD
jgi:dTDP-4-dehydrorhamnose reductase